MNLGVSMIVYDFDGTIYDGDSSVDFFIYCMKTYPACWRQLPAIGIGTLKYMVKKLNKTQFKQCFFSFLQSIPDVDQTMRNFWDEKKNKFKRFYLARKHAHDIIISASPHFLLEPICKELGVHALIASVVDKKTGAFTGENCRGQEKVRRLKQELGDVVINEFYSDSLADSPLAEKAKVAFMVKGNTISTWSGKSTAKLWSIY